MLPEELFKKVRQIELSTRKVVTDVMTGNYKSHFKGQGLQFSEHRIYSAGDDVRHIDWKASARSREPLIKKYDEERELTVLILVDISKSGDFGSGKKLKREMIAEVSALIAYAGVLTGDRVGAILFSGKVEKIIPPKKGRTHVWRIVTELLEREAVHQGTSIQTALKAADHLMKHAGMIFVVSDFLDQDYQTELKKLARRHDLVAIRAMDPKETKIPKMGLMNFYDPESGKEIIVDTASYLFQSWLNETSQKEENQNSQDFKSSRMDWLKISTQEDYAEAVVRFFRTRSRKR